MTHLFERTSDVSGPSPVIKASAPGRVEILGNHTDYNGGTVVGAAIDLRLRVAVRGRDDDRIRMASTSTPSRFETTLSTYRDDDGPDWTKYTLGVADELMMYAGGGTGTGFDLLVDSDVPSGAGVSSSAALELATGLALNALWDLNVDLNALIRLAHRAENRYVGVPCGLLDQAVCGAGRQDALVVVDASEDRIDTVPFPGETRLVLCSSHVRRSLAHSMYETRYSECRDAHSAVSRLVPGLGALADLHPFDTAVYGPALDPVLRRRADHVVAEEDRVTRFLDLLRSVDGSTGSLAAAGELMTASHRSSQTLFENSCPELDFLVDRFIEQPGVLGCRLTGAGWGGAVVAWIDGRFDESSLAAVTEAYAEQFDAQADARFVRPSDGARLD
ncbi:MAG: galactokinase [Rhodothermales bacterium]|nr:galactokinase [Rhodothermales bacterium]